MRTEAAKPKQVYPEIKEESEEIEEIRMVFTIEKAEFKDFPSVYELVCTLEECRLDKKRFEEIYRSMLQNPDRYALLVARTEKEVIGFADLRFEDLLHHAAKVAELLELVINPQCRSEGVGQALFDKACPIAKERGCVQIECSSNQRRTRAHAFYLRNGMKNDHYGFSLPLD